MKRAGRVVDLRSLENSNSDDGPSFGYQNLSLQMQEEEVKTTITETPACEDLKKLSISELLVNDNLKRDEIEVRIKIIQEKILMGDDIDEKNKLKLEKIIAKLENAKRVEDRIKNGNIFSAMGLINLKYCSDFLLNFFQKKIVESTPDEIKSKNLKARDEIRLAHRKSSEIDEFSEEIFYLTWVEKKSSDCEYNLIMENSRLGNFDFDVKINNKKLQVLFKGTFPFTKLPHPEEIQITMLKKLASISPEFASKILEVETINLEQENVVNYLTQFSMVKYLQNQDLPTREPQGYKVLASTPNGNNSLNFLNQLEDEFFTNQFEYKSTKLKSNFKGFCNYSIQFSRKNPPPLVSTPIQSDQAVSLNSVIDEISK